MQFESFSEFIQMGGHGRFVFSVYLITAVVVLGNLVMPLVQKRRFYQEHAASHERESERTSEELDS